MASARAARCGEGPLPPRGRASRGRASQVWRPNQISSLRAPLRAAPTGGGNEKFLFALKPSRYPARARRPFLTAPATAGRRVPRPRPLRLRSPARGSPRRPPSFRPLRSAVVRGENGEMGEPSERQGDTRASLPPRRRALRLRAAGAGSLPLPAGSSRAPLTALSSGAVSPRCCLW